MKKYPAFACSVLLAFAFTCLRAQTTVPPVDSSIPNTIRIWGDDAAGGVLQALQLGFRNQHPGFRFQDTLYGSGTGMAGIITGTSDIAVMGRPATANEIMGFEWVYRYKPLGIEVMNGSERTEDDSPALAVLVHSSNPLREISLQQLKSILGCTRQTGSPAIRTWGEMGLRGEWQDKPVRAYIYDNETGTGAFLQAVVLGHQDKWNWSAVREFRDRKRSDGGIESASDQIADALRSDGYGIAVAPLSAARRGLRALPVARQTKGPSYPLTRDTLIQQQYPLSRAIYFYVNRAPGRPLNPDLLSFLQFVLSRQGLQIVSSHSSFLPLDPAEAASQRAVLTAGGAVKLSPGKQAP